MTFLGEEPLAVVVDDRVYNHANQRWRQHAERERERRSYRID
jgi:hypothetical protein